MKNDLVAGEDAAREYLVIVHVRNDSVFSRYFKSACGADMALFRGMFLKLGMGTTEAGKPCISSAAVHQAFLPKFENEGQDADIAAGIQRASADRYMTVTVKHSGSLATMSHDLLGAKNSQGNVYTAVAGLLIQAHYERVASADRCEKPAYFHGERCAEYLCICTRRNLQKPPPDMRVGWIVLSAPGFHRSRTQTQTTCSSLHVSKFTSAALLFHYITLFCASDLWHQVAVGV